jgi:LPS-assembly protein
LAGDDPHRYVAGQRRLLEGGAAVATDGGAERRRDRRRDRCRRLRRGIAAAVLGLAALTTSAARGQSGLQLDAGEGPVVLTADELVYDATGKIVTALGNVEVSRGERRLLADRVRYDEARDRVLAQGNVVLIEPTGDALFGEEVEVTGDLKDGLIKGVRALRADDSRFAGVAARRERGERVVIEKAVYSPCNLCPEGRGAPLWQVRAERVTLDEVAQDVIYRNARLEFFGLPVLYTPYLSQPAPNVRKRSGFLIPQFGIDSELGTTVQVPYFINLAPNRDLTLAPLLTTKAGPALFVEGRDLESWGRTIVTGSIANTDRFEDEKGNTIEQGVRGHVDGRGRYRIDDTHFAGFDAQWASDKSYQRLYGISGRNINTNHAFLERLWDDDYWGLNAFAFQGLRTTDDQDTTPFALPLAEARLVSERWRWGSRGTLDSSLLLLGRTRGRDVQRLSNEVGWEVPQVGAYGDVRRLRLSLRGDVYYVAGDPLDPTVGGGTQTSARVLPRATVDWSLPLIGGGAEWQHEVEPVASLNVAPTGGNSDNIPNEDSIDFEFDESNLLLPSRYTGLDVNEGGTKLAYGVRFTSLGPQLRRVSGAIGQNLQITGDNVYPRNSGLAGTFSNLVGRLEVRPSELLDIAYRFRFDASSAEFARADLNVGIGPSRARINLRYVKLSAEAAKDASDRLEGREALIAGVRLQITDNLAVAAQTRRDLKENSPVANTFGLLYADECFLVLAGLEKDFTQRGEVDEPLTFTLRIGLRTLGDFEIGSGLFGL